MFVGLAGWVLTVTLVVVVAAGPSDDEELKRESIANNIEERLTRSPDAGLADIETQFATGGAEEMLRRPEMSDLADEISDIPKSLPTGPAAGDPAYMGVQLNMQKDEQSRLEADRDQKVDADKAATDQLARKQTATMLTLTTSKAAYAHIVQGLRWKEANESVTMAGFEQAYLTEKTLATKHQVAVTKAARLYSDVQAGAKTDDLKAEEHIDVARRVLLKAKAILHVQLVKEKQAEESLTVVKAHFEMVEKEVMRGVDIARRTLDDKIRVTDRTLAPLREAKRRSAAALKVAQGRLKSSKAVTKRMEALLDTMVKKSQEPVTRASTGITGLAGLNVAFKDGEKRGKAEAKAEAGKAAEKMKNREKLTMYAAKVINEKNAAEVIKEDTSLSIALQELGLMRTKEGDALSKLKKAVKAAVEGSDEVSKTISQAKGLKHRVFAEEAMLRRVGLQVQKEEMIARTEVDAFTKAEQGRLQVRAEEVSEADKDTQTLEKKAAAKALETQELSSKVVDGSRKIMSQVGTNDIKTAEAAVAERTELMAEEEVARKASSELDTAFKKASKFVATANARLMDEAALSKSRIAQKREELMQSVKKKMDKVSDAMAGVKKLKKDLAYAAKGLSGKMANLAVFRKKALVARHGLEEAAIKANEASKTVDQIRRLTESSEGRLTMLKAFDAGPLPIEWEKKVNHLIDGYESGVQNIIEDHRNTVSAIVSCHNQAADVVVSDVADKRLQWDPSCNKFLDSAPTPLEGAGGQA